MQLLDLQLTDFRNYSHAELHLQSEQVVLLGDNAQGKSNLLEAIGFTAFGHSPRAAKDLEAIRHGAVEAIIRSTWRRATGTMSIDILLRANGRRAVRVDGNYQRRLSDLLGRVRLVFFSAEDLAFVKGAPGDRRRYLDLILYQLFPAYYAELQHYQKVVGQRNAWLRGLVESGRAPQPEMQEVWDEQLIEAALPLIRRRRELITDLDPRAARYLASISDGQERLELQYRASVPLGPADDWSRAGLRVALQQQLQAMSRQERARGQTLVGPHRDDLAVLLNGEDTRAFASQGQQRSIVLALKLAELEALWQDGDAPILLLDDVLAELDVRRQTRLLHALADQVQTFITTTHIQDFAADWLRQAQVYQVKAGSLELE